MPLTYERSRYVDLVQIAENPRIDAPLHQGKSVAHDQLISAQPAIALTGGNLGDDAAYGTQSASIRDELQLDRQRDKFLEWQLRVRGNTKQPVFKAGA